MEGAISGCSGRRKSEDERKGSRTADEEICELDTKLKDNHKRKAKTFDTDSDREWLEEEDREKGHTYIRKRSFNRNKDDKSKCYEGDSDVDWAKHKDREKQHRSEGRSSRQRTRDSKDRIFEVGLDGEWLDKDRDSERPSSRKRKSSRHQNRNSEDCIYAGGSEGDWSYRDGDREMRHHRRSKSSKHLINGNDNLTSEAESNKVLFYGDGDMETQHGCSRKSSRHRRVGFQDDYRNYEDESDEDNGDCSGWERNGRPLYYHARKGGKRQKRSKNFDDQGGKNVNQDSSGEWSDENRSGDRHHSRQRK